MNRRDLIKLLPVAGVGILIPFNSAKSKEIDDGLIYKDFEIFWTGWKTAQDSTRICGQWIAHSKKKMWGEFGFDFIHIHSNAPNRYDADQHLIGQVFLTPAGLYVESSNGERESEKYRAYTALVNKIDTLYSSQEYYKKKAEVAKYYSDYKFGFTGFRK